MKKLAIFILFTMLSSASIATELDSIEVFAASLINIIRTGNVDEFKKIDCVKIPCGDIGKSLIVGNNDSSNKFKEIMSKDDITFKIFGPYTVEPEYPDATYSIVFYSLSNPPFGSDGGINMDVGYAELYRTFLQTQVTVVDGEILFQRVPFYLEYHHPYVGDYG